jgi:hypothetical protein
MAQLGSKGTTSLFTPLNVADVLIPGEEVRYVERKHGASLIPTFVETASILILITMIAFGIPLGVLGVFIALVAAGSLLYSLRNRTWRRLTAFLGLLSLVLTWIVLGSANLAVATVILTAGRFVYRFAMWAFYERLFITNRRLMASKGFLGAEVNSIPLTRATDIAYKRTFWGEILGYGEVKVETAGQDQALSFIDFLNRPDTFYNILIGLSTTAVGSVRPTKEVQAKAAADDA